MNYKAIKHYTKKQFDAVLKREGRIVTDYFSKEEYSIIIRKSRNGTTLQRKLQIYYSIDCGLKKGSIFNINNETFIIMSEDDFESDIYISATAKKCTATFMIDGTVIPFLIGDFASPNPKMGTVNTVNGSISLQTQDNAIVRKMTIDTSYIAFGGTYKVVNYFYNDNIAFVYLKRDLESKYNYSIKYLSANSYDLADETFKITVVAYTDESVDSEATFTYTSSDTDVATVDENGVVTMLKSGNITISVLWNETSTQLDIPIEITETIVEKNTLTVTTTSTSSYFSIDTQKVLNIEEKNSNEETVDITERATITYKVVDKNGNIVSDDASNIMTDTSLSSYDNTKYRVKLIDDDEVIYDYIENNDLIRIIFTLSDGTTEYIEFPIGA